MGPNYFAERGDVACSWMAREIAHLTPAKRSYPVEGQATTESAIRTTGAPDLYVVLGDSARGRALGGARLRQSAGTADLDRCLRDGAGRRVCVSRAPFAPPARARGGGRRAPHHENRACAVCSRIRSPPLPRAPPTPTRLADPALEARARALQRELRCMVCQGESLDEFNAPLAADLASSDPRAHQGRRDATIRSRRSWSADTAISS